MELLNRNRIQLFLVCVLLILSCKNQSTKTENIENREIVREVVAYTSSKKKKSLKKLNLDSIQKQYNFKKVDNLLKNKSLISLTKTPHYFTDEIVFNEVNVLKTAEDTYSVILVLSKDEVNFEEFVKWTVAIIVTPENPQLFEKEEEKKKGSRTIGIYNKPEIMGDEVVIHLKDFKMKPKDFSFIRFYLYNDLKETNINYLVIKNTSFPN